MKLSARLIQRIDYVRYSYWFLPALMALGAVGLAAVSLLADERLQPSTWEGWGWLFYSQSEGARSLLATIAGSMITVAGVTFSITIAAVSYASAQYGPRILGNFMRDRGNQVTLGTFIATFLYCLILLRTVRVAGDDDVFSAFLPHIGVLVAMLLTLASVGVLIYFIHHVTESIHLPQVVARIGRGLVSGIEGAFPDLLDESSEVASDSDAKDAAAELPAEFFREAQVVSASGAGYMQTVDEGSLLAIACERDLVLRLVREPGEYVRPGGALALVWPPSRVSEEVAHEVRSAFAWGAQRSLTQDLRFPADELVEVAARALSPGVNDPFTAINCMDWLSTALLEIARRVMPSALHRDEAGALRVLVKSPSFASYAQTALGQLRPYAARDVNAARHQLCIILDLVTEIPQRSARRVLVQHAERLLVEAERALPEEALTAMRAQSSLLGQLVQLEEPRESLRVRYSWRAG